MGRSRNQINIHLSGKVNHLNRGGIKTIFGWDKFAHMCRTCLQFIKIYEVAHYEYVPPGQTENQMAPYGMWWRMRQKLSEK
jgi:hypothetical protein